MLAMLQFLFLLTCFCLAAGSITVDNVSLNATSMIQHFHSPNFPSNYPMERVIHWTITAANDKKVLLIITKGDIETCCDSLEINEGDINLGEFTGIIQGGQGRISSGNSLTVTLQSDESITRNGFNATYVEATCGDNLLANDTWQSFTSPGWPDYVSNQDCYWMIYAPPGKQVEISVTNGTVQGSGDYIRILDGLKDVAELEGQIMDRNFVSTGLIIRVHYHTDTEENTEGRFITHYRLASCTYNVSAQINPMRLFTRNPYANDLECEWIIVAPSNSFILLVFLGGGTEVCCDLIQVYENNKSLATLSGDIVPGTSLLSTTNTLRLTFTSDATVVGTGFNAIYQETNSCGGALEATSDWQDLVFNGTQNNCFWIIKAEEGKQVQFKLKSGHLESKDFIEAFDGLTVIDRQNEGIEEDIYTSSNGFLRIHFLGNQENSNSNFSATYKAADCGSTIKVGRQPINFTSPGWPSAYPNSSDCTWNLIVGPSKEIELNLVEFSSEACCDFLSIYNGRTRLDRLSGESSNRTYFSTGQRMRVTFTSNGSGTQNGFRFTTHQAPCKEDLSSGSVLKNLTSPGWPNMYVNNLDCSWNISASEGNRVVLELLELELEECCDTVYILRGGEVLGKFSRRNETKSFVSELGGSLVVRFSSDGGVVDRGFRATYVDQKEVEKPATVPDADGLAPPDVIANTSTPDVIADTSTPDVIADTSTPDVIVSNATDQQVMNSQTTSSAISCCDYTKVMKISFLMSILAQGILKAF